jgi:hypothetical protein
MKTACDCDNNDSDNKCRICNFLNFLKGLLKESTGFLFQGRVHSGGLQIPTAAAGRQRNLLIYTFYSDLLE